MLAGAIRTIDRLLDDLDKVYKSKPLDPEHNIRSIYIDADDEPA